MGALCLHHRAHSLKLSHFPPFVTLQNHLRDSAAVPTDRESHCAAGRAGPGCEGLMQTGCSPSVESPSGARKAKNNQKLLPQVAPACPRGINHSIKGKASPKGSVTCSSVHAWMEAPGALSHTQFSEQHLPPLRQPIFLFRKKVFPALIRNERQKSRI